MSLKPSEGLSLHHLFLSYLTFIHTISDHIMEHLNPTFFGINILCGIAAFPCTGTCPELTAAASVPSTT
jgi:hypothetical protein